MSSHNSPAMLVTMRSIRTLVSLNDLTLGGVYFGISVDISFQMVFHNPHKNDVHN